MRKLTTMFLLLLAAALPLFAQDIVPSQMVSLAERIQEIFTGGFVRTILVCCLCGSAIAYAFNKDSEKVKRNALAILISSGVLIGASGIVQALFGG